MNRQSKHWIALISVSGLLLLLVGRISVSFLPGPNREVLAVALQSTGKAVLGGRFADSRIERRNLDGSVDATFASKWVAGGFNYGVLGLAVQGDDRIVAVGDFTNFDSSIVGHVARLNADGSLDTEFARATGTGFDDSVTSAFVQPDGKIVVGGNFTSFNGASVRKLARLNPDGTLDTAFKSADGADGAILALQPSGANRVLAGGEFQTYAGAERGYLANILADGGVDPAYPR